MMTLSEAPDIAPLWRRLASILYDSLLVLALWMLLGFIFQALFGIEQTRSLEGEQVVMNPLFANMLFIAMLLSAVSFFCWFWMKTGQTLGMLAWKIKLTQVNGQLPTLKQCITRTLLAPFSFGFFLAGYLIMLFNEEKATFHDLVSGTRVIRVYPAKNKQA